LNDTHRSSPKCSKASLRISWGDLSAYWVARSAIWLESIMLLSRVGLCGADGSTPRGMPLNNQMTRNPSLRLYGGRLHGKGRPARVRAFLGFTLRRVLVEIACLDLEGVLVPEIWIAFAEKTGIEALKATTRDIPDYDVLMKQRLRILDEHGLKLRDIQEVKIGRASWRERV